MEYKHLLKFYLLIFITINGRISPIWWLMNLFLWRSSGRVCEFFYAVFAVTHDFIDLNVVS